MRPALPPALARHVAKTSAARRRILALACTLACALSGAGGSAAWAATGAGAGGAESFDFAVIGNLPSSTAQEPYARRVLSAIGQQRGTAFIVHNGNLKGPRESCGDDLLLARKALLDSATLPLIYLPGENDWIACKLPQGGGFDALERLDFIRDNFFGAPASLGAPTYKLTRESEISRFSPYRENVRWEVGRVLFVGLDVPDGNNHFSDAGGRNGEFEERTIANAFWLRHSLDYAKRRKMKALVIIVQGNPDFARETRRGSFSWLQFTHRRPRDGYLEFKQDLAKLADSFAGPVLLIHDGVGRSPPGFRIDRPLHNTNSGGRGGGKGAHGATLTRLEIFPAPRPDRWLQIRVSPMRMPVFSISVRHVPANLPLEPHPGQPGQPAGVPDESAPPPSLPAAPDLLPLPPASDSAPELPGLDRAGLGSPGHRSSAKSVTSRGG
jgi:hypothetical protein